MNKDNFIEADNKSGLSNQTKFRLNEIKKSKTIFTQKFKKEKQWVKNSANTLLLLIILTKL